MHSCLFWPLRVRYRDTNAVVTEFLAKLLHDLDDPDPMSEEAATFSEDAVAKARSTLHLPTRLKNVGIRRMATVRDPPSSAA